MPLYLQTKRSSVKESQNAKSCNRSRLVALSMSWRLTNNRCCEASGNKNRLSMILVLDSTLKYD
jgi:hypothetical protein